MKEPEEDETADSRLDAPGPQHEAITRLHISRLHLRLSPPKLVFIEHLEDVAQKQLGEPQA